MNSLDHEQEQTQKLAEIGAYLNKVRQQKGVSLEEISAKTLISTRLLRAIEECELDELPEAIYVQAHIRRFADALGVNGAKLAEAFPLTIFTATAKLPESVGGLPKPNLRPYHLYILYVLLIVGAISGLSYLIRQSPFNLGEESEPPVSPPTVEATPQSLVEPAPPTSLASPTQPVVNSPTPKPTAPAFPLVVHMTLKDASWVRIVVDGKTTFEDTLKTGTNKSIGAQKKVVVFAGNAGGVLIAEEGSPAKLMGESGSTAEVSFEAKPETTPSPSPATTSSPTSNATTPMPNAASPESTPSP